MKTTVLYDTRQYDFPSKKQAVQWILNEFEITKAEIKDVICAVGFNLDGYNPRGNGSKPGGWSS